MVLPKGEALMAIALFGLSNPGTALRLLTASNATQPTIWKEGGAQLLAGSIADLNQEQVLFHAKCGVVFVAIGETYSRIAYRVAHRTRHLPVRSGWCPLDPALDHIPVTLFTDLDPGILKGIPGVNMLRLTDPSSPALYVPWLMEDDSEEAPQKSSSWPWRRWPEDDLEVLPESRLRPWRGHFGDTATQTHLGGWKVRWYHAQALLGSPYEQTLYLDVDAHPCGAQSIARLMWRLHTSRAGIMQPAVKDSLRCKTSRGDCSKPHPMFRSPKDVIEWPTFYERNAGVIVFNRDVARPILEEFPRVLERMASSGLVTGDQYSMRESLFRYRDVIPQVVLGEQDVCRYLADGECETEHSAGCAIHHRCHMQSLVKYGMVDPGTFNDMGLMDT